MMAKRKSSDRVQGLLVMLPWLFEREVVSIDEMAATFGLDRETLLSDLNLSTFCGTPPYTPDELVEIFIEDDEVWIREPRIFTRPLRLTVEEAFTLKAVGEAALAVMGTGTSSALASALAKLPDLADDAPVVVRQPRDPKLAELEDCAASHEILTIDYYTPLTDKSTSRDIVPMRLWVDGEHWYCDALDFLSGEHRLFRLDRMKSMKRTGRYAEASALPAIPDEPGFNWSADSEVVTLHLKPAARWVAERYPTLSVKPLSAGSVEVKLHVANEAWLGRLLVRAGNDAKVVAPSKYATLAGRTARQIRARYA
jgi:proteasome accessory factor C